MRIGMSLKKNLEMNLGMRLGCVEGITAMGTEQQG